MRSSLAVRDYTRQFMFHTDFCMCQTLVLERSQSIGDGRKTIPLNLPRYNSTIVCTISIYISLDLQRFAMPNSTQLECAVLVKYTIYVQCLSLNIV